MTVEIENEDLSIGQKIRSPDGLGEILKIITSKFDKDRKL